MSEGHRETLTRTATAYFREVEAALEKIDAFILRVRTTMRDLLIEYAGAAGKRTLVIYGKYRGPDKSLPTQLYVGRICRPRPRVVEHPVPGRAARKIWIEHQKEGFTRKAMYLFGQDVAGRETALAFQARARQLNAAKRRAVRSRMSVEHRLVGLEDRRPWEGGDLAWPAPALSAKLPDSSKSVLGCGWPLFLRAAAVECEVEAVVLRHNRERPHPSLWLAFRRDGEHPYGRFIWTLNGEKLSGRARQQAKGRNRSRVDDASLPDRVLRTHKVPLPLRRAIAPHEAARRRVAVLHDRYMDVIRRLREAAAGLREAEDLLGSCPEKSQEAPDLRAPRQAGTSFPEPIAPSVEHT